MWRWQAATLQQNFSRCFCRTSSEVIESRCCAALCCVALCCVLLARWRPSPWLKPSSSTNNFTSCTSSDIAYTVGNSSRFVSFRLCITLRTTHSPHSQLVLLLLLVFTFVLLFLRSRTSGQVCVNYFFRMFPLGMYVKVLSSHGNVLHIDIYKYMRLLL